jgi:hypothetical protein
METAHQERFQQPGQDPMRKVTIAAALIVAAAPVAYVAAADHNNQPTTSQQVSQAASDAWQWLKKETKAAWDATSKAFSSAIETRHTLIISKELPTAISGKRLLGAPLENGRDGKVGSISDLVFGGDSRVDAVVVSEGGFLGIGADKVPMKPSLITIRRQPDGSFKARTNVSEDQIDRAGDAAFMTSIESVGPNYDRPENRRLAKLIGATVIGPNGDKVATIEDVLLSPTGDASYAVLSLGINGPHVVVSFGSLKFTRSDQPLQTSRTTDNLSHLAQVQ